MLWILPAQAGEDATSQAVSAKDDYITCWKQPCIYVAGSKWSEKNPNGVAVAVAMGTKPVVTDVQIKEVLSRDFTKHGVTNIKFFFEQNDTPATRITFHVRGGTEGIFLIDTVRNRKKGHPRRGSWGYRW
ncbi:MAG: hypothetical protein KZQ86_13950 [Candidatus Thiodiazotropha sp. (ex Lucinoma kastoroae)]|nr:hypothetical protein [Candidatus Thiodiazotropha sp. (ex Lucinoma kastoroae)]